MSLPTDLLLDSLAGRPLPELWTSLENLAPLSKLVTSQLIRQGSKQSMATAGSVAPHDHGLMIVGVHVLQLDHRHLPESGVLAVQFIHGELCAATLTINFQAPWSRPALLLPIRPRQQFCVSFPPREHWAFPDECTVVEFWGYHLPLGHPFP